MAYDPLETQSDFGFFENLRDREYGDLAQNIWEGARDEWLGIDDFGRFAKNLKSGNFFKAMKSLGTGVLELGGTALMFVPGGQGAAIALKGAKAAQGAAKGAKAVKGAAKGAKAAKGAAKAVKAAPKKENFLFKFLRPLSLEEEALQKAMLNEGARRRLFGAPKLGSKATQRAQQRARELVKELGESDSYAKTKASQLAERVSKSQGRRFPVGASRGGIAGSIVRGAAGFSGVIPAGQGPLARRAAAAELSGIAPTAAQRLGRFASGKTGAVLGRTSADTAATEQGLRLFDKELPVEPTVSPMTAQLPLSGLEQLSDEELMMILALLEQGYYER